MHNHRGTTYVFCFVLLVGASTAFARDPGTGPWPAASPVVADLAPATLERAIDVSFESRVFTERDLVLFSWSDSTVFTLRTATNAIVDGVTGLRLDAGGQRVITAPTGTYRATANAPFSALAGDPVSNAVCGYFARDARGLGVGTRFHTWAPRIYGPSRFVVFGHEDDTDVTVTVGGVVYATFSLDDGERWTDATLSERWVTVEATRGVSVLSAYDQGYFTPASDGRWTGRQFDTYVGAFGDEEAGTTWKHDLLVIAYENTTAVAITDTDTGETIWSGTLQAGQVHAQSFPNGADRYLSVAADRTVAVAAVPWASYPRDYHWGTSVPDRDGFGVGREFLVPTPERGDDSEGVLRVTGHLDQTTVRVFAVDADTARATFTVNRGETIETNPERGLWRVTADRVVSVWSGWGEWSADFAPLTFAEDFDPLNAVVALEPAIEPCLPFGVTTTLSVSFGLDPTETGVLNEVTVEVVFPEEIDLDSPSDGVFVIPSGDESSVTWPIGNLSASLPTFVRTVDLSAAADTVRGTFVGQVRVSSRQTGTTMRNVEVVVCDGTVTSVAPIGTPGAERLEILTNRPNPFNPTTTIAFTVERPGPVQLAVFDAHGRRVTVLVDEFLTDGRYESVWNGVDQFGVPVASGIYFYRLQTDDRVRTRKMTLVE